MPLQACFWASKTTVGGGSMKCASLYTLELDDFELGLKELTDQLNNQIKLKANTVGIINCHPEFIDAGMVEFLGKNLPFDIIGTTTAAQSTNGTLKDVSLTIFVITADDVEFILGLTEPLENGVTTQIDDAVKALGMDVGSNNDVKLIISFVPTIFSNAGDIYPQTWSRILPGVPVFGGMSCDTTAALDDAYVIFKSETYRNKMSFVLCKGNINPRFMIATLPSGATLPYRGEISRSVGNLVYELNGIEAATYLKEAGVLDENGYKGAYWRIPFEITSKESSGYDQVPIMRTLSWESISENEPATFLGEIKEGSLFIMRDLDSSTVVTETKRVAQEAVKIPGINGIIGVSCILRRISLIDTDPKAELKAIQNAFGDIPFIAGYVAGEICPTSVTENDTTNRFHNCTTIFCII